MLRRQGLSPYPSRTFVADQWLAGGNQVLFSAQLADTTNVWRIPVAPRTGRTGGPAERVTFGTGLEANATAQIVAGGGLRVAFSNLVSYVNLWSIPIDANRGKILGEVRRLTDGAAADAGPSLSGDGSRLIFESARSGEIRLRNLATGREQPLASVGWTCVLSRDGSKLAYALAEGQKTMVYTSTDNPNQALYLLPLRPDGSPGTPQKLCEGCGAQVWDWSTDGRLLLAGDAEQGRLACVDPASGKVTDLFRHRGSVVARARFSPDDRWIAFHERQKSPARTFIIPFRDGAVPPESQWIAVTDGANSDGWPMWSPDGQLLYLVSDRDGFFCLWAQRLDGATKRPAGGPFAVLHLHSARRSITNMPTIWFGAALTRDKLILNLGERTGNIWMAALAARN